MTTVDEQETKKAESGGGSNSGWDEEKHPRNELGEFTSVDRGDGYKGSEDKKESVKGVQDVLLELGFLDPDSGDNGGKDGIFGPKTEAALKEWQRANGYEETGRVTPWTMKKLKESGEEGRAFVRDRSGEDNDDAGKGSGGDSDGSSGSSGGDDRGKGGESGTDSDSDSRDGVFLPMNSRNIPKNADGTSDDGVSGVLKRVERMFLRSSDKDEKSQVVHVPESKRDFSESQREKLAKQGHALPDGSFPIASTEDLKNAISAYGRAKNQARAKRHIIKRARAMGKESLLPDDWTGKSSEKSEQDDMETKVRHVRTPAGERWFDQPIGSIIVSGGSLGNLAVRAASALKGHETIDGKDGNTYYVAKSGQGYVAKNADQKVIKRLKSEDRLYNWLDDHVAENVSSQKPAKKPRPKSGGGGKVKPKGVNVPGATKQPSEYEGTEFDSFAKYTSDETGDSYYVGQYPGEDVYVVTDAEDNVLADDLPSRAAAQNELAKVVAPKTGERNQTNVSVGDTSDDAPTPAKKPAKKPKPKSKPESAPQRNKSGNYPVPKHKSKEYIDAYNKGWAASSRGGDSETGGLNQEVSEAYEDGYLDHATDRPKWSLAHFDSSEDAEAALAAEEGSAPAPAKPKNVPNKPQTPNENAERIKEDMTDSQRGDVENVSRGPLFNGLTKDGRDKAASRAQAAYMGQRADGATHSQAVESARKAAIQTIDGEDFAEIVKMTGLENPAGRQNAKDWANAASVEELRAAMDDLRALAKGDRRKNIVKRARNTMPVLSAHLNNKVNENKDKERRQKEENWAQQLLNEPNIQSALDKVLGSSSYDPKKETFNNLEYAAHEMPRVVSALRATGQDNKADRLRDRVDAAQNRLEKMKGDVQDYVDGNAQVRKNMDNGVFADLTDIEKAQYRGTMGRVFPSGKRGNVNKEALRKKLSGDGSSVNVLRARDLMMKIVDRHAAQQKRKYHQQKFDELLATAVKEKDTASIGRMLDMIDKTINSGRASDDMIERMNKLRKQVEGAQNKAEGRDENTSTQNTSKDPARAPQEKWLEENKGKTFALAQRQIGGGRGKPSGSWKPIGTARNGDVKIQNTQNPRVQLDVSPSDLVEKDSGSAPPGRKTRAKNDSSYGQQLLANMLSDKKSREQVMQYRRELDNVLSRMVDAGDTESIEGYLEIIDNTLKNRGVSIASTEMSDVQMTRLRTARMQVEAALKQIKREGTQKSLAPLSMNFDQKRMYEKFDKAVESKDMDAAVIVGKRIVRDAKANGAHNDVVPTVEDALNGN